MAKNLERFQSEIKKIESVKLVARNFVETLKRWSVTDPAPAEPELKARLDYMTKHPEDLEVDIFSHRFPPTIV